MARRSMKGGDYEREFAKLLSAWWLGDGSGDLLFWRTGGSGGLARVRGRKGLQTTNSHGDIGAIDPRGSMLTDLLVVELKRGYNVGSLMDVMEIPKRGGQQLWEEWIQKAEESVDLSGCHSWVVICRRDQRPAIICFPWLLFQGLKGVGAFSPRPKPFLRIDFDLRLFRFGKTKKKIQTGERHLTLVCTLLSVWLESVSPKHIRSLCKEV
jgi:hypothetical protein